MKLTKNQLQRIIKEEIGKVREGSAPLPEEAIGVINGAILGMLEELKVLGVTPGSHYEEILNHIRDSAIDQDVGPGPHYHRANEYSDEH
tara:strand:+ start:2488 stop:2754 length:267 start_codon:yes stop_codon:yes gene_type:complete